MFRNLLFKTLYDKRWFMLGWSLGLIAMLALTLAFFPALSQGNGLRQLLTNVPKQLQGLLGDIDAYRTATGYLASAIFDLRIPLLALPMAIILGISLGVSEEASGQLYQLIARPISRGTIVFQKWLALLAVLLTTHIAMLLGAAATLLAIHEHVAYATMFSIILMSWLLTLVIGSITLLLGFATGRKGLVTALSSMFAFASYLVTSFVAQVSWLKKVDYVSLFHYYKPTEVAKHGLNFAHVGLFVGLAMLCVLVSVVIFSKRDIGLSA